MKKKYFLLCIALYASYGQHIVAKREYDPANDQYKNYNFKALPIHPDKAFGGNDATGVYNSKNKSAMVKSGETTYFFSMIVEDRNPKLPKHKNQHNDLVCIGWFVKRLTRGIPITMYVYGKLIKTKNSSKPIKKGINDEL